MSDLSTALKSLTEVMNNIQANKKVYRMPSEHFPVSEGGGKHPVEAVWVSNADGSKALRDCGYENHAISMSVFFRIGDQKMIKMRAMIAKYEAEKLAYYKALDGETVWQIVTEEDYYEIRSYMMRNGSTVERIRVWREHLDKFADVEDRIEQMPW